MQQRAHVVPVVRELVDQAFARGARHECSAPPTPWLPKLRMRGSRHAGPVYEDALTGMRRSGHGFVCCGAAKNTVRTTTRQ